MEVPKKVCNTCKVLLPLYEFYHCNSYSDGHMSRCISCTKAKKTPSLLDKLRKSGITCTSGGFSAT